MSIPIVTLHNKYTSLNSANELIEVCIFGVDWIMKFNLLLFQSVVSII